MASKTLTNRNISLPCTIIQRLFLPDIISPIVYLRKIFVLLLFIVCYTKPTSAQNQNTLPLQQISKAKDTNLYQNSQITYKIIHGISQTYGYDISVDGRLMVHQPNIPCIVGNKGFRNKTDAKKVAELVIQKIRKGILPPTVAVNELKELNIDLK